jgi:hypothetical protein
VAQVGVWYHVVATFDGTSIRLYINGAQEGGTVASTGVAAALGGNARIAGFTGTTAGAALATQDECATYDYALTSIQVANHYALASG